MAILKMFSEKEKNYHLYQARQNALREERERDRLFSQTAQRLQEALQQKEEALQQKEEALQQKEEERKQKEEERKQKERLMEILKQAGIDPHS